MNERDLPRNFQIPRYVAPESSEPAKPEPVRNVITNEGGQFRSADGPQAVRAFGLRVLASGLRFEIKCPGMKISRVSALAQSKQITGLRTNDRKKHLAEVERMLGETVAQCEIVTK